LNNPITLLIADDSQTCRRAIRRAIEYSSDQILVVGEAANGEEALELTSRLHPDVILLDVEMPRLNGIQAASLINRLCPASKIIMFSVYDSKELVLGALKGGAQGYLVKGGSSAAEIIQAIQAVAHDQAILSPLMLGWVLDKLAGSTNGKQPKTCGQDQKDEHVA